MSIDEVDELFYLLENPTRRRILQLLSVERLYPLQLSREIDVTQPWAEVGIRQTLRCGSFREL